MTETTQNVVFKPQYYRGTYWRDLNFHRWKKLLLSWSESAASVTQKVHKWIENRFCHLAKPGETLKKFYWVIDYSFICVCVRQKRKFIIILHVDWLTLKQKKCELLWKLFSGIFWFQSKCIYNLSKLICTFKLHWAIDWIVYCWTFCVESPPLLRFLPRRLEWVLPRIWSKFRLWFQRKQSKNLFHISRKTPGVRLHEFSNELSSCKLMQTSFHKAHRRVVYHLEGRKIL